MEDLAVVGDITIVSIISVLAGETLNNILCWSNEGVVVNESADKSVAEVVLGSKEISIGWSRVENRVDRILVDVWFVGASCVGRGWSVSAVHRLVRVVNVGRSRLVRGDWSGGLGPVGLTSFSFSNNINFIVGNILCFQSDVSTFNWLGLFHRLDWLSRLILHLLLSLIYGFLLVLDRHLILICSHILALWLVLYLPVLERDRLRLLAVLYLLRLVLALRLWLRLELLLLMTGTELSLALLWLELWLRLELLRLWLVKGLLGSEPLLLWSSLDWNVSAEGLTVDWSS